MVVERQLRKVGVDAENRERKLEKKIAVVIGNSWDVNGVTAEIAIALAREGRQIIGIVHSRKEEEKATRVAVDIEYNGGWMDVGRANVTAYGRIDILVSNTGSMLNAANALVDKINKGGKIVFVTNSSDSYDEQALGELVGRCKDKELFLLFVPCEASEHANDVGQKVVELLKRDGVPTGHTEVRRLSPT